jgi:hypothetical protein
MPRRPACAVNAPGLQQASSSWHSRLATLGRQRVSISKKRPVVGDDAALFVRPPNTFRRPAAACCRRTDTSSATTSTCAALASWTQYIGRTAHNLQNAGPTAGAVRTHTARLSRPTSALGHAEGLSCALTVCQAARQHTQSALYSTPAVSESTEGTKRAPFRCRHRTAWHWVRPLGAPAPSTRAGGPPAQSRHAVVAGVPRRCATAAWQLTRPPAMRCPSSENCHGLSVSSPGSAAGLVS